MSSHILHPTPPPPLLRLSEKNNYVNLKTVEADGNALFHFLLSNRNKRGGRKTFSPPLFLSPSHLLLPSLSHANNDDKGQNLFRASLSHTHKLFEI